MSEAFLRIADANALVLPNTLQALYRDGRTTYGPDWPTVWKRRMLEDPPALISAYDIEWNSTAEIEETIASWLAPTHQHGRRFFPFAQSGAGDQYCLSPLDDGRLGVALIWHDRDQSNIAYPDFDAFLCARFIATMADLSHLIDDDFTPQDAHRCLLADLDSTGRYLPESLQTRLRTLASGSLKERPYRYGPKRIEPIFSLITQDDEDRELERVCIADPPSFDIVARWDLL
jgi:hypothetical protein